MKTFTFLLVVTALATPALAQDTPRVTIPDVGHVTRPDTGYVTVPDQPQVTVPDTSRSTVPDTPRGDQAAALAPPPTPTPAQGSRTERDTPPPPAERRPLPTRNVKVDVTISEQGGTSAASKKVLSLVVADGRWGSVRSMSTGPTVADNRKNLPLSADVNATLTPDQRVLLELRFTYSSYVSGASSAPSGNAEADRARTALSVADLTENLTVLLTSGAPAIVARSADAASDRTVTVEVKAEILK